MVALAQTAKEHVGGVVAASRALATQAQAFVASCAATLSGAPHSAQLPPCAPHPRLPVAAALDGVLQQLQRAALATLEQRATLELQPVLALLAQADNAREHFARVDELRTQALHYTAKCAELRRKREDLMRWDRSRTSVCGRGRTRWRACRCISVCVLACACVLVRLFVAIGMLVGAFEEWM